jgi:hypothetical protein
MVKSNERVTHNRVDLVRCALNMSDLDFRILLRRLDGIERAKAALSRYQSSSSLITDLTNILVSSKGIADRLEEEGELHLYDVESDEESDDEMEENE